MKVVSWQNVLTEHQSHTLRALQERLAEPIEIVAGVSEHTDRVRQGWRLPNVDDLSVRVLSKQGWMRQAREVFASHPDAVHIFVGLWADRRFLLLIIYAIIRQIKVGLITEPYSELEYGLLSEQKQWKGQFKLHLRPLLYRMVGFFLGKFLKPVFAISAKASRQFVQAGFDERFIFPFGYFVPRVEHLVKTERPVDRRLSLVFVGSLIATKGIGDAIMAVTRCQELGVSVILDVFGPGDFSQLTCSIPDCVHYRGVIEFGQVQSIVAGYDCLILPSRHDGWGVVVNEALLQGVPVLVSDGAGAADMVTAHHCGAVFESGNIESLATLICEAVNDPDTVKEWGKNTQDFADNLLPSVAADYMVRCLEFCEGATARPVSPW